MTPRLVLTALLLLLPAVSWGTGLRVAVDERSEVGRTTVTLGSIAEVSGPDAELVRKVRGLEVHRFEAGESSWRVSGRAVGQALWEAGVGLDRVEMDIPLGAQVRRGTVRLSSERVAEAVREQLGRTGGKGVRIRVVFPEGAPAFKGLPAKGRIDVARDGEGQARVRVSVDGQVVASRAVAVELHRERRVVVARENLRPGTRIEPEQVKLAYREAGENRWAYLSESQEVVGSWVMQAIGEGHPVKRSQLRLPPEVRSGDPVTLVYDTPKLRITAPGTVRQQGALGEVLAMENQASGKQVYARLIGSSKARVVEQEAGKEKQ
ncbi:flagellar basal body P-ring formation chaperone FlgA [Thiohalorhabdus methylotrophus]|uniref:Flagella basal body P-ring formation protein FlgA n=1 Tax=Thiohalorhabdus methylotrophus TaxID=3242694 RepID=A0ABV4TVW5_9GAMM